MQARIWWRRAAYLAHLLSYLVLLLQPITAVLIDSGIDQVIASAFEAIGHLECGRHAAEWLFVSNSTLADNITLVAPAVSGAVPGFTRIYVDTML